MRPPQLRSIELLCSLFAHYLQTAEYKKWLADIEAAEAAVKKHGADTIAKPEPSSSTSSSRAAKKLTYGGLLETAQSRPVKQRWAVAKTHEVIAQINVWDDQMAKKGPNSVSLQGLTVLF